MMITTRFCLISSMRNENRAVVLLRRGRGGVCRGSSATFRWLFGCFIEYFLVQIFSLLFMKYQQILNEFMWQQFGHQHHHLAAHRTTHDWWCSPRRCDGVWLNYDMFCFLGGIFSLNSIPFFICLGGICWWNHWTGQSPWKSRHKFRIVDTGRMLLWWGNVFVVFFIRSCWSQTELGIACITSGRRFFILFGFLLRSSPPSVKTLIFYFLFKFFFFGF